VARCCWVQSVTSQTSDSRLDMVLVFLSMSRSMHGSPEERPGEVGGVGGVKTRGGVRTKRGNLHHKPLLFAVCKTHSGKVKGQIGSQEPEAFTC